MDNKHETYTDDSRGPQISPLDPPGSKEKRNAMLIAIVVMGFFVVCLGLIVSIIFGLIRTARMKREGNNATPTEENSEFQQADGAYTDTTAAEMQTEAEASEEAAAISLEMPVLGDVTVEDGSLCITWESVADADGYYICRSELKDGSVSSWETVGTVEDPGTLTWQDTDVVSGCEYMYTVKAYAGSLGDIVTSSFDSVGLSVEYLAAPMLSSTVNTSKGIKVHWESVEGADSYILYRKSFASDQWGEWKKLEKVSDTEYLDEEVEENHSYRYTVRAVTDEGGESSRDDTGMYERFLLKPEISDLSSSKNGEFTVTWKKKSKVTGYEIRYSRSKDFSENAYTVKVEDAAEVTRTFTKMKWGAKYYVTVRTYKVSGERTYYSPWSKKASVKVKG